MKPPQVPSNVSITRVWSFTSASASGLSITDGQLLGICGAVCDVANTSLRYIAATVKVHSVEIWTPPSAVGAASTCLLSWASSAFVLGPEVADTSMSTAMPAHIKTKPPPGSAGAFVLSNGANLICKITAPAGSVIRVHATHVLLDSAAVGTSYAVAAGTLGVLYYLPLDGTGDQYLPIGLNTTT